MGRTRRMTLREAAEILGISKDAVRKRINRGTLGSDMGEDGRRYVYLPAGGDAGGDAEDKPSQNSDAVSDHRDALISELRAEVEAWREESRRKDHIIAGLVERLPLAIEPSEPQNQPESARNRSDRVETPEEPEKTTRRPWWRRVLGG